MPLMLPLIVQDFVVIMIVKLKSYVVGDFLSFGFNLWLLHILFLTSMKQEFLHSTFLGMVFLFPMKEKKKTLHIHTLLFLYCKWKSKGNGKSNPSEASITQILVINRKWH